MVKQKCNPGYKWCPIHKKCMPVDNVKGQGQRGARGQGKGPMGNPRTQEAIELVDIIFDEGFETYGKLKAAEKELDMLLDMCGKPHREVCEDEKTDNYIDFGKGSISTGRPYDHPIKTRVRTIVDECEGSGMGPASSAGFVDSEFDEGPAKEEDPQKKQNVINTVPNQDMGNLYMAVRKQMVEFKNLSEEAKEDYKAFFNRVLKKFGVNSPAELDADQKKKFFNVVDKGWTSTKEQRYGGGDPNRPSGGFGSIGGKSTAGGFGSIMGRPKEQDDLEDEDEDEVEEQVIRRPDSSPSGGFGSIGGKSTAGGFGTIKGRPQEQDDLEDEDKEEKEE